MAKKSRRARAQHRTGRRLPERGPGVSTPAPKAVVKPKAAVSSVVEPSIPAAQATRHQYVLSELRRVGIIAGALFLVLVVLTFMLG